MQSKQASKQFSRAIAMAAAHSLPVTLRSVAVPSCSPACYPAVGARLNVYRIARAAATRALHSHLGSKGHSSLLSVSEGSNHRWIPRGQKLLVVCAQVADFSSTAVNPEAVPASSKVVLVVGATGSTGQLIVASLLEKGVKVRGLVRNGEKAQSLFGDKWGDQFEFQIGDTRQVDVLNKSLFEGITHVINATGTTAFPTRRWSGNNGPEQTDWIGVRNLIDALPKTLQRVLLVSSVGVTKYDKLPYMILNMFGVLKYKKMAEDHLRKSGIPFTIMRPGRLEVGTPDDIILGQGDELVGTASRMVVAEACVHALDLKCTEGQIYELCSVEGDGPGIDAQKWASKFQTFHSAL